MAVFKFSHKYRDKELEREVAVGEEVEMTIKRADEVVKNVQSQKGYEDFAYERLDKPPEEKPVDDKKEKQGKGE